MITMDELKKKYGSLTIGIAEKAATGILTLNGGKTSAVLHSPKPLAFAADDRGWFDVRLSTPEADDVFLHHALVTTSGTRFVEPPTHVTRIYPNVVVVGAGALAEDGKVSKIIFAMEHLSLFFHYEFFERIGLRKLDHTGLESVKALRNAHVEGVEHDFFNPIELHLFHRVPRFLKFRSGKRIYEVFASGRLGSQWASIDMEMWPRASIKFDEPITIDGALDHVWEWRRYFESMAMTAMRPLEISVSANKKTYASDTGSVYLPGLERPKASGDTFGPHLRDIPLKQWKERRALSAAMKAWLQKGEERKLFRASVNKVLRRYERRVNIQDILILCSGIESLDELKVPSADISGDDVESLTNAAYAQAKLQGIKVTEERLKGLMGMLRMQSLQGKMRAMSEAIQTLVPLDDCEVVIKAALKLRNTAAHGKEAEKMLSRDTAPTVEGLLAICVFFDMYTSGVAAVSKAGRPHYAFGQAVKELRALNPPKK